jgi:hypothetical protein
MNRRNAILSDTNFNNELDFAIYNAQITRKKYYTFPKGHEISKIVMYRFIPIIRDSLDRLQIDLMPYDRIIVKEIYDDYIALGIRIRKVGNLYEKSYGYFKVEKE